jgi:hypothetical protein
LEYCDIPVLLRIGSLKCRGLISFSVLGEAQYVNDIPTMPGEVYAAFTLTTMAQGYIANIDPSQALVRCGTVLYFQEPSDLSFCVLNTRF